MSDKKSDKKNALKRIKTGAFERQWQLTKSGIKAGSRASTQMWGSMWLNKEKRQQRNSRILSEQAHYLVEEMGKLKGAVVKVGQMMALYGQYLLPEEISEALRELEENTTALAWPIIEDVLKANLGAAYDDFLIESDVLGAASLAQVHQAVLKTTQEPVCLKVQYPGVAQAIDSDINSVVRLLRLMRLLKTDSHSDSWLDEIRRLLHAEVDYQLEAEKTQRFCQYLQNDAVCRVPTVYPQYSNNTLLVTSFESGFAVNDAAVQAFSQEQRNQLGQAFLSLFLREVFEWGEIQTDPNFGNYRVRVTEQGQAELVLLDFGSVMSYPDSFLIPLRQIVIGAYRNDKTLIRQASIDLGIMRDDFPDVVHKDFAQLCLLLLEPFTHQHSGCPEQALNAQGEYCWAHSKLPKRAAKHAAQSAMSRYFVMPPKEFAFVSRKLLGVYSFIAALSAEFNPPDLELFFDNAS